MLDHFVTAVSIAGFAVAVLLGAIGHTKYFSVAKEMLRQARETNPGLYAREVEPRRVLGLFSESRLFVFLLRYDMSGFGPRFAQMQREARRGIRLQLHGIAVAFLVVLIIGLYSLVRG